MSQVLSPRNKASYHYYYNYNYYYRFMAPVRNYLGELVTEETFTHSHLS